MRRPYKEIAKLAIGTATQLKIQAIYRKSKIAEVKEEYIAENVGFYIRC